MNPHNPYTAPAAFEEGLNDLRLSLSEEHHTGITAAFARHRQHSGADATALAEALFLLQSTLGFVLADTKIGTRSAWREDERPAANHIACPECAAAAATSA